MKLLAFLPARPPQGGQNVVPGILRASSVIPTGGRLRGSAVDAED